MRELRNITTYEAVSGLVIIVFCLYIFLKDGGPTLGLFRFITIFFCVWSEGVKQFEIYRRNLAQYGRTLYGTENCHTNGRTCLNVGRH